MCSHLRRDLSGGTVVYRGHIELQGVTLQSKSISLDPGAVIRQPTKDDLEKPVHPIGPFGHTLSHPSSILEIELRSTRGRVALVQVEAEKCVALLRLFDVGSVKFLRCETSSDSFLDPLGGGILYGGQPSSALETYFVKTERESLLQKFWTTMST